MGNAIDPLGRILLLSMVVVALLAGSAHADRSPLATAQENADRLGLADDPTWLRLLHYEPGHDTSSVKSDSFFLDPDGRRDPAAELAATLQAWFEPDAEGPDQEARCRFPARYYWLSHQLDLPGYRFPDPDCTNLANWALFDRMDSISLLLVSGYLGNPASSFGHVLLRLDSSATGEPAGLMDLTVGFGALVPQFENPILYIVRGLGGFYDAGFSDKYFYTQDLVYSRSEFRDIWEYRLNLTEYQRNLLQLHIWEIVGHKFQYFFLAKNCAYRIAELLALALDDERFGQPHAWYIPVTLFHQLEDVDRERRDAGAEGVIDTVRFLPSDRRRLYHELAGLEEGELETLNGIVRSGIDSLDTRLEGSGVEERTRILDALISYQKYRLMADKPDSTSEAWRDRDRVLLKRLGLPRGRSALGPIEPLPSPAAGFPIVAWTVGGAVERGDRIYGRLGWSPYRKESIGRNSLEGSELVVFDTIVGFGEGKPYVFLDRFDVLRITSLNTSRVRIEGERRTSWDLRLGVERIARDRSTHLDVVGTFGVGRAFRVTPGASVSALLTGEAHSDWPHLRVVPGARLIWRGHTWGLRAIYGMESIDYEAGFRRRVDVRLLYQLGHRHSVQAEYKAGLGELATIGISRYF